MRAVTRHDFIQEYTHALYSDFSKDGVPATFVSASYPLPWSSAPISFTPSAVSPGDSSVLALNCDETLLAVAVLETIQIYDAISFDLLHILSGHADRVEHIDWHPTASHVLASSSYGLGPKSDSLVRLWDLHDLPASTGDLVDRAAQEAAEHALSVLFSDDSTPPRPGGDTDRTQIASEFAKTLQLAMARHDVHAGRALVGGLGSCDSYAFDHAGVHLFYTLRREHVAVVYDVAHRQEKLRLAGHTDMIMWIGASPDDALVATSSLDQTVRLWDAHTGAVRHVLEGASNQNWGGAFSPDGAWVAAGCGDAKVRVWDVQSGELLRVCEGRGGWLRSLSFGRVAGDGLSLVAAGNGSAGGCVCVFDMGSGERTGLWQVDGLHGFTEIGHIKHSADGRRLAFKGPDGRLVVYEAETNIKWEFVNDGERRDPRHGGFVFARGGARVWSLDHDGVIRAWDLVQDTAVAF